MTGGSSGIGQAIAVRFARQGANVAINYLTSPDEAAETDAQVHACMDRVRRQGVRDVLVQGDVSSEQDVVRMVEEAAERLGGLDILVNNAGIQISRPSEQLASADFDRVLAVNLRGRLPVRPRSDQALPGRRHPGRRDQCLERSPGHPEAELSRLQRQQGRDAEPDQHACARVRRPGYPRQRDRSWRDDHPDQPRRGSTTP